MHLRRFAIGAVLSAAIGQPVLAAAAPLAPSTPWTLDYAADSCALRRIFGVGDDQVFLEIRRFEPGLGLQTEVASNGMKARNYGSFKFRFGSGNEWQDVQGTTVTLNSGGTEYSGVLFNPWFVSLPEYTALPDDLARFDYRRTHDLRAAELEVAAKIDTLTLRGAFRRELALRIGRLDAPIEALDKCIDNLVEHWGIDAEAHKTLTRPALPVNLREVGRMIDYPPKMIQRSLPGVVNIRLDISETGRVTGCHIQMPLSDPAFEETSCADIQHALDFDPALDKDGKPIPSYWVTRVIFQLD